MEYFVGVALALATVALGRVAKFDRDRSFYPVVAVVVASYYDLFAIMAGRSDVLLLETLITSLFVFVAVVGLRTNLWIVVAALVGHGTMDLVHGYMIANPGVPEWWPAFCAAFDVIAGGGLAYLLLRAADTGVQAKPRPPHQSPSRPYVFARSDASQARGWSRDFRRIPEFE